MKKILFILSLFVSIAASSQRLYDTTFTGSSAHGSLATTAWNAKVFLPAGFNWAGTDSFQLILFEPGLGEMNTTISGLALHGPIDYLDEGWDGGIVSGTRKYYPIIVALQPPSSAHARPQYQRPKIEAIMTRYRIKRKSDHLSGTSNKSSVHLTGLSQGGWATMLFTGYLPGASDYSCVSIPRSAVIIGGVNPTDTYGSEPSSPSRYYPFAQRGGRYWFLRNSADGVGSWMAAMKTSINGNTANSVVGVTEPTYGSGGHNSWERFYGGDGQTPGEYSVDSKTMNIYKWMIMQGDTVNTYYELIGEEEPDENDPPTANAGSDQAITLPINTVTLSGTSSSDPDGTISTYLWEYVSGPAIYSLSGTTTATATASNLVAGTYIFKLTVQDNNGATDTDSTTITVNSAPVVNFPRIFVGEYQSFLITEDSVLYGIATTTHSLGTGSISNGYPLQQVSISNRKFTTAASGLHHSLAVDQNEDVWTWGWTEQGQSGNGTVSGTSILTPVRVSVDSTGNVFTGIIKVASGYSFNAYSYNIALKSDGTLWGWGGLQGGLRGDGTEGGVRSRPVQFAIPGDRKVIDIACGENILVLCEDGTVWNWGGGGIRLHNLGKGTSGVDHRTITQVTALPSDIIDITGGGQFSYAITSGGDIWGWGFWGEYARGETDYSTNASIGTAIDLTSTLNLPDSVVQIYTNSMAAYAVLSNGEFWVWGDNITGALGTGTATDPDDFTSPSTPCVWSIGPGQDLEAPQQVLSGEEIVYVSEGTAYVFYCHVTTGDGQMFATGRNKTSALGNGITASTSTDVNDYPDSWNVKTWTEVDPLSISSATPTVSPCNTPVPPNLPPTSEAGTAQSITLPTSGVTLTGSGEDSDGTIASYAWSQQSGPSTASFTSATSASTAVTGLVEGAYVFRLTVTDNEGATGYDEVTIIVNKAPVAGTSRKTSIRLKQF